MGEVYTRFQTKTAPKPYPTWRHDIAYTREYSPPGTTVNDNGFPSDPRVIRRWIILTWIRPLCSGKKSQNRSPTGKGLNLLCREAQLFWASHVSVACASSRVREVRTRKSVTQRFVNKYGVRLDYQPQRPDPGDGGNRA